MAKLASYQLVEIAGETAFGTAGANFDYIELVENVDRSGLTQESIERPSIYQTVEPHARIPGRRNGQIRLRLHGHGYSTSIPSSAPTNTESNASGAAAFDHFLGILASAFGNLTSRGYLGSATLGSSGSPVDTLTGDDLSTFESGQAVAWATGDATEPYEVGWLTSVDTSATPDEAGLLVQPNVAPQGATLWGSHTLFTLRADPYHSTGPKSGGSTTSGSRTTSWTVRVTAHDTIVTCRGCRPVGVTFEWQAGQLPVWEITMDVAYHTESNASGLPAAGSYAYPEPQPGLVWRCTWGTDMGAPLTLASFRFDLGLTRSAIEDGSAVGGVGGFYTPMRRPRVTIQVPREDVTQETAWTAQTEQPLVFVGGTRPGKLISFCLPAAGIVERPPAEDADNRVMTTLTLEPRVYTGDTGTAGDQSPVDTGCRLAFL